MLGLLSVPFGFYSNLLLLVVQSITAKANQYPLHRFKTQLPTGTHCLFPTETQDSFGSLALPELLTVWGGLFV